jgi:hypothetical protein
MEICNSKISTIRRGKIDMSQGIITRLGSIENKIEILNTTAKGIASPAGGGTLSEVYLTYTRPADTNGYIAGDVVCTLTLPDLGVAGDLIYIYQIQTVVEANKQYNLTFYFDNEAFPEQTDSSPIVMGATQLSRTQYKAAGGANALTTSAGVSAISFHMLNYAQSGVGIRLLDTNLYCVVTSGNTLTPNSEEVIKFKFIVINYGQ